MTVRKGVCCLGSPIGQVSVRSCYVESAALSAEANLMQVRRGSQYSTEQCNLQHGKKREDVGGSGRAPYRQSCMRSFWKVQGVVHVSVVARGDGYGGEGR